MCSCVPVDTAVAFAVCFHTQGEKKIFSPRILAHGGKTSLSISSLVLSFEVYPFGEKIHTEVP